MYKKDKEGDNGGSVSLGGEEKTNGHAPIAANKKLRRRGIPQGLLADNKKKHHPC
jgi:hypothetical protein